MQINKLSIPHKDLIESIRAKLGGTATPMAAELALRAVAQAVRDGLREDGEVRLAKFGTFKLKTCKPRRLLLPRTGEAHTLPERTVLRFTPSTKRP